MEHDPLQGRFSVRADRVDGALVVYLSGEMDLASKGELPGLDELRELDTSTVVIDAAELGFMDSTGLTDILAVRAMADEKGGTLRVRNARPNVRQVFALTRLTELLED